MLSGKSPLIVMDDVDVAEAAAIAHAACFENHGQCCWYVKHDISSFWVRFHLMFKSPFHVLNGHGHAR